MGIKQPEGTDPARVSEVISGNAFSRHKFENLKQVPEDSIEAELYQIIDDISTAGDMFKPEINAYFRYIHKQIEKSSKFIVSDGYKLYYVETQPTL